VAGLDDTSAMSDKPRDQRRSIPLPVMVRGFNRDGSQWDEMTTSDDISSGGARFALKHPVFVGQVLELSLPLPNTLRKFDLGTPSYRVFSIVRSVTTADYVQRVGAMYYGQRPPRGFKENPTARFVFGSDTRVGAPAPASAKMRNYQRHSLVFNTRMRSGRSGNASGDDEVTITEDISAGGARILTARPLAEGDEVVLDIDGGAVRTPARIRGSFIGADGVRRLNVSFSSPEAGDAVRSLLRRAGAG
jgi:hypothetical protein